MVQYVFLMKIVITYIFIKVKKFEIHKYVELNNTVLKDQNNNNNKLQEDTLR